MSSRSQTLTFAVNKNGPSAGGNAGKANANAEKKSNVVQVNTATKSLYLGVATGRAFPYVARWLQEKSSEMRDRAGALESDCNTELVRQVNQKHKGVIDGRMESLKENQNMLKFLQEIQSVRVHQRVVGAAWLASFHNAADAYRTELRKMEEDLRRRLHIAEEWTVGGQRTAVMAKLSRMEQLLDQLRRRADREQARETMRRDQTHRHMCEAMEKLVGEVGDTVTWELHQRIHGHAHRSFSGLPTAVPVSTRDDVSEDAASSSAPSGEQELLEEERQLKLELRRLGRLRGKREDAARGRDKKRARRPVRPQHGETQAESLPQEPARKQREQRWSEEGVEQEGGAAAQPAQDAATATEAATKTGDEATASLLPQLSSPITTRLPTAELSVQSRRLHGDKTWTEVVEGLTLPPLVIPTKAVVTDGGEDAAKVGNQQPAESVAPRTQRRQQHRGLMGVRPLIVQPPTRVGLDASGRLNSDHIASLLAVLAEDTAHFATSRGKMQAEVKRLRDELRKHQEETARMMQVSIGLESKRAQLLVQRDAQVTKLQLITAERCSQEHVMKVDAQLLNEELSHTLQVLEEKKRKRFEEMEQVRESISDFRQRIVDHNRLLQQVREYWRRNVAVLRLVKNTGSCSAAAALRSTRSLSGSTDAFPAPLEATFRSPTTSVPSTGLVEEGERSEASLSNPLFVPAAYPEANIGEQVSGECQSIPALGLYQPDEVAEFIYSVFE
ncbi:hypothetical protein TraAM80_06091 [Trypanosoma rangeli]|uniref:Uncharacterized protein n=1 Tax=Trypanosoma rangeli TaxID=5698 RepID=A0A422NBR3_TRYRA|nr:uncharacterized protein TraAM80_06091 [Trypanosoma rangeli]RNF02876.1 hypothetical protein TraAM80_06091 [Trypanosoma rangeli]|eukprot:RNF02876.1 hypothetical protein TraAM80_06091 [Trypanosoma rangeli]